MLMTRKIKTKKLYRSFTLDKRNIDKESRTVEISFSSEATIERFFGFEILDHDKGSVRLDRINDGAPLLKNHRSDQQVGIVESAKVGADKMGRATIRFSKGQSGEEEFQDVIDGIRTKVSVGYRIHEALEEKKDGISTYRIIDWEPLEISMVSIPADITVGVNREDETEYTTIIKEEREKEMSVQTKQEKVVNLDSIRQEARQEARESETARITEINAMGEAHECRDLAQKAIKEGTETDSFRSIVLEQVLKAKPTNLLNADIGMTGKEKRQFSFVRAINAAASRNWKDAGLEREASDAVALLTKRSPQGFFVPNDMTSHKRVMTVGTPSAGGNLVATDLLSESFIDLLRNKMLVRQMGAQILGGLVGDVAVPSQTGGATSYWVPEGGDPTVSQPVLGQLGMTPKTVGAFTDISRKLLLQSSIDVENLVKMDLSTVLALAIDLAAINGSGASNQPTGILNTVGIGDEAGGTNGGAPTWANIVNLWKLVAGANAAFGTLGFLTTVNAAAKLMTTEKATGTAQFIWPDFPGEDGLARLAGFRAGVTEQVPSNLSKGTGSNLSAIIFGNFSDLIIGEWGALDVLVDPFTGGISGTTRVRVLQDIDVLVRRPASFSVMADAITI